MKLHKEDRILFLGDSVTDCGRDWDNPEDLGKGYALMTAGMLAARQPLANFTFLNRGISGNKIQDVLDRLDKDCLALKPDVLLFMIGINDTWHNVASPEFGTPASAMSFESRYREFLERVTTAGIHRILLVEPFVLPYPVDRQQWRKDLDPKLGIIRQLAAEFGCELLCLDGRMNEMAVTTGCQYLTGEDGVHPTPAGHGIIAQALMEKFE